MLSNLNKNHTKNIKVKNNDKLILSFLLASITGLSAIRIDLEP